MTKDNTMQISMIAAIASGNRALGKNNELIYKIREDLQRFKKITSGHIVIMGRKTFESIGKPLPIRTNIVITHDPSYAAEGIIVAHSLEEALRFFDKLRTQGDDEVFVIGGGQIYQEAMGKADKLYLTVVEGSPDADTFFPDYSEFKKVTFKSDWQEHEGFKYKFLELER